MKPLHQAFADFKILADRSAFAFQEALRYPVRFSHAVCPTPSLGTDIGIGPEKSQDRRF